jgi:large subunit ribosomal protein L28
MAKSCAVCGKTVQFGHNISHAHNVTKRRWQPNLPRVKVVIGGKSHKIDICTRCLRSGAVEKLKEGSLKLLKKQ